MEFVIALKALAVLTLRDFVSVVGAPNEGARARPGPTVRDRPLRRAVGSGPRDHRTYAFAGGGQEAYQGARGEAYSQLHQVR